MRHASMLPRVALVDPVLTYDMPPSITASTGLDALTQCLEPFVSHLATPLTDGFCREGMRRAARSLRHAFRDGSDPEASVEDGVAWVRSLSAQLAVPPLAEYGVREDDLAGIVEKSLSSSSMKGNPISLTQGELAAVLGDALQRPIGDGGLQHAQGNRFQGRQLAKNAIGPSASRNQGNWPLTVTTAIVASASIPSKGQRRALRVPLSSTVEAAVPGPASASDCRSWFRSCVGDSVTVSLVFMSMPLSRTSNFKIAFG